MNTKELLLLILISCMVIKNDADEMPIEDSYENNQTQNEDSEDSEETNGYNKKNCCSHPKKYR
jgi:hypothetical protein